MMRISTALVVALALAPGSTADEASDLCSAGEEEWDLGDDLGDDLSFIQGGFKLRDHAGRMESLELGEDPEDTDAPETASGANAIPVLASVDTSSEDPELMEQLDAGDDTILIQTSVLSSGELELDTWRRQDHLAGGTGNRML